jgi:phospholipase/carboxylesterase
MARIEFPTCLIRPREGFYNSVVQAPCGGPLRTFLPTGYEPNYPYPLVVFLHGHGGSDEQVLRLAPRVSRRNYVCIGLRGPHAVGVRPDGRPAFSWGDAATDSQVEDYVLRAIEDTRRRYHVHSERIYLAGFREGAAVAYRLGLLYPDRFGGIASLNGLLPRGCPLLRLPDVRRLRVLIGHGIANSVAPLGLARADFRLLYTAGLDVRMHTYAANHRIHPDMLRDIDRWIMDHVNEEM